jgi:flagellar hook-associated protein 2
MGTTSTTYFNGTSTFSAQLQQVISRTVGFARLPITQLQNEQSTLTNQQTELQTVGSNFYSLHTALDSINTSVGSGSYSAASSNQTVATASVGSGAQAGNYSVSVTSAGSQTNTISSNGLTTVTDPSSGDVSTSSAFTLTVGTSTYQISNTPGTLNGLAAAINASGAAVQATVINVGGSASPDYRLSIQGTQYSPNAIQLNDGTRNLLTNLTTGSNVTYQVNGQPAAPVSSTSRALNISPGVTVNVLAAGSTNITVAAGSSGISSALSAFAASYNSALDELVKNRGQNGGALAGQSVVSQVQNTLNSITGYSSGSSGSVNSLADLGLTFDANGHLQFAASTFGSATSSSLTNALSFLGSETGGGFLQAAAKALSNVTDPTNGIITQQTNSLATSIESLTTKIGTAQTNLTTMQNNLTTQLANADAAIASLQAQVSEITMLFSAEQQQSRNITG